MRLLALTLAVSALLGLGLARTRPTGTEPSYRAWSGGEQLLPPAVPSHPIAPPLPNPLEDPQGFAEWILPRSLEVRGVSAEYTAWVRISTAHGELRRVDAETLEAWAPGGGLAAALGTGTWIERSWPVADLLDDDDGDGDGMDAGELSPAGEGVPLWIGRGVLP
jgi:hypothetical protein